MLTWPLAMDMHGWLSVIVNKLTFWGFAKTITIACNVVIISAGATVAPPERDLSVRNVHANDVA
jgi:hypothetical protein